MGLNDVENIVVVAWATSSADFQALGRALKGLSGVLVMRDDATSLRITCVNALSLLRVLAQGQIPSYDLKSVYKALRVGPPINFFHRADINTQSLALIIGDYH
jgi:hypothetical protein